MIVSNNVFLTVKTESEVCGIVNAPSPNDNHEVFLGDCNPPNTCIKSKCLNGSSRIRICTEEFLK